MLCRQKFDFRQLVKTCANAMRIIECRYLNEYANHLKGAHMQKLLNKKGARGKKKWYQPHVAEPMELLGTKTKVPNRRGATEAQRTRAKQLSHVLYDKITQLMNTGELSEEILNKQVFITAVKMNPDFGGVNVYWDSNRADSADVEVLLQANAGKLRSLLISYHVLGRIPPVTFVKDKSARDLTQLEQLLGVADYGSDYIPSSEGSKALHAHEPSNRWSRAEQNLSHTFKRIDLSKDQFMLSQTPDVSSGNLDASVLSSQAGWNDDDLNASEKENDGESQNSMFGHVFKFRSDVYGLPREDLMKKVMVQRTKVKFQGGETLSDPDQRDFSVKQLNVQKDKWKLKFMKDSTKFKQRRLERDTDDFKSMVSNDHTDFGVDDKFYDDLDDANNISEPDDEWQRK